MMRRSKAQSIVEYVILSLAVSSAVMVMSVYVKRAMYSKFADIRQELNESQRN